MSRCSAAGRIHSQEAEERRRGRLHNLLTLGVGGHINPDTDGSGNDVLLKGLIREINEEIELQDIRELHACAANKRRQQQRRQRAPRLFLILWRTSGDVFVRETDKLEGPWCEKASCRSYTR
jgi:predicted NUDIX family phosphoesterase